jgi:ferredoxin
MSTQQFVLSQRNLLTILLGIAAGDAELFAPQRIGPKLLIGKVTDASRISFEPLPATNSSKELLFPRVECLISFKRAGDAVIVDDHSADRMPQRVLFGTRPCDAVALKRLGDFFAADTGDMFVAKRREQLTVISMSCTVADADCFCTSAGSGPGDTNGSDVLLTPLGETSYSMEIVTERGRDILAPFEGLLEKSEAISKEDVLASVELVQALEGFGARLSRAFSHEVWKDASLRCIGCGACAYVCPLCSCFNIEDEGTSSRGDRLRCWDSCGFSLFTLHTSGHNPRPTQSERWRQRVMHKFSYMPERFGFAGCVGCGRCSRACPADMNLKEQILTIASCIEEQGVQ